MENRHDGIMIGRIDQKAARPETKDNNDQKEAMAIDKGIANQKSMEILLTKRGSKRNTNEAGAVGCINTGFRGLSINGTYRQGGDQK